MQGIRKAVISFVIGVTGWAVARRVIVPRGGRPYKANMGCGLRCLPGWINIDGSLTALFGSRRFSWWNRILYVLAGSSAYYTFAEYNRIVATCNVRFFDLRRGVPVRKGSLDILYTSNFLEHLGKNDGRQFLKGCFRALRSGGLLRIEVPDLEKAWEMYKGGDVERSLDTFFYTAEFNDFSAHRYAYSYPHLREILKDIGFAHIEKKGYQHGECPDIAFLDAYVDNSLFVECKKP